MLPGTQKLGRYRIDGGDLVALSKALLKAREQAARLGKPVRVLSCYQAGLDEHWLRCWPTGRQFHGPAHPRCSPRSG
ncbi:MAG: hypothetical protein E6614_15720 [Bradyrhizobium sp.]|jgi:transposase|uniref:Uncharacterized protein n=1 Tax=Bradyrhizobium denitrificans TaxID=2734912 RepID=A0ABS5G5Y7_9BRAD|nr:MULTISPECIES: hypothetical protein [Bradyrhizobium]ABQ35941.1 hypothetical protein BBta_3865 [Bradyrhizobium sp. BTAi1]MBR1136738.1 hypothetical protein [Bradyrhizobium denitrificans]MDU0954039.1 hypothetical protein [Bradyrhizobium sp.]MDU1492948.1 hypothetical protein [Bradyrhizobium sp.]MDU1543347.1 hypothetical protein [Bradyrhizobium sp.]